MNEYFQTGAVPAPSSPGASSVMRQEFANIAQGFDKLPVLAGHSNELVVVDGTGTRLVTTGSDITGYVTKDGVFTLTNKTIAWADNTFPGFGTGATKNAGSAAGEVPVLVGASLLPVLDGSLLTNLNVNQAGSIVDIAHGGTGANTYAGAQAALGIDLKADANNAVLTGAPTAPHPPTGNDSARIATTHFVQETVTAIGGFGPGNAVPKMNGVASPGVSTLGARDDHAHPTDTSRAPTSAATAAGTSFAPAGGIAAADVQAALVELDSEKANLASPTFTGDPKAPTPTAGGNDTSIATTAFVQSAIAPLAPLASPVFTGDPRAPTTATSDNDTSIATTAFVQSLLAQQPPGVQVSNSSPLMNGVVAPGAGVEASRYDHVHPVDTSRAPASASTATGTAFTPVGGVAATNVQAAITELDTEKVSKSGDTMTGPLTISNTGPFIELNDTTGTNFALVSDGNAFDIRQGGVGGAGVLTGNTSGLNSAGPFSAPYFKANVPDSGAALVIHNSASGEVQTVIENNLTGSKIYAARGNLQLQAKVGSGIECLDPIYSRKVLTFIDFAESSATLISSQNGNAGNATQFHLLQHLNNVEMHNRRGPFYMQASSSGGVILNGGATAWAAWSDERMKTGFVSFDNALSKVCSLRAGTGRYLTDEEGASRSFLIAQDVQAVLPEAVDTGDDGMLLLRSTDVIPLLVAAIKELTARVAELESKQ